MRKEDREKWLARKRLKIPFPTSKTIRLWELTYHALITSFLLGMEHSAVDVEPVNLSDPDWKHSFKPLPFEEAIRFLTARVPLTREEFYALEPKFRFRAFTVARLTELDAINRCKGLLKAALDEGLTFQQFLEKGREDVLLKAGFHQTKPWYWETVFRTNIQTAYNAGRKMQIEKAPEVQYLEFVGIRDSRQTDICRARSGVIRPKGDPWWKTNWPPLHFNCRSTVRTISRFEAERRGIRVTRKNVLEDLPDTQEGFGLDPLEAETFWKLTPSMIERARKYGVLGEIRELARWLGLEKKIVIEKTTMDIEVIIEAITTEILAETNNRYEIFVGLDKNGQKVLKKKGGKRQVFFDKEEQQRLLEKAEIGIHNHPSASSFSDADLFLACKLKLNRMIVTSDKFDYEINFHNKWPDPDEIKKEWLILRDKIIWETYNKLSQEEKQRVRSDKTFADLLWQEDSHKLLKALASRYKFTYRRRRK